MVDWILTIVAGLIIGWAVGMAIQGERPSIGANTVLGFVGAVLGRWFFVDVLGIGIGTSAVAFALLSVLWAVIGSLLLVGVIYSLSTEVAAERMIHERGFAHDMKEKNDEDKDEM